VGLRCHLKYYVTLCIKRNRQPVRTITVLSSRYILFRGKLSLARFTVSWDTSPFEPFMDYHWSSKCFWNLSVILGQLKAM
jgi:hypothetical protein